MSNLGPLPRQHPREQACNEAERDIELAIATALLSHALTEAEGLRVVNAVASRHIGGVAKYAIRQERHGDADKPGGLE